MDFKLFGKITLVASTQFGLFWPTHSRSETVQSFICNPVCDANLGMLSAMPSRHCGSKTGSAVFLWLVHIGANCTNCPGNLMKQTFEHLTRSAASTPSTSRFKQSNNSVTQTSIAGQTGSCRTGHVKGRVWELPARKGTPRAENPCFS